jgi:hypothetical protein
MQNAMGIKRLQCNESCIVKQSHVVGTVIIIIEGRLSRVRVDHMRALARRIRFLEVPDAVQHPT